MILSQTTVNEIVRVEREFREFLELHGLGDRYTHAKLRFHPLSDGTASVVVEWVDPHYGRMEAVAPARVGLDGGETTFAGLLERMWESRGSKNQVLLGDKLSPGTAPRARAATHKSMNTHQESDTQRAAVDHQRLVQRDGAARIEAYQQYHAKHCATDADMRRTIRKNFPAGMKFQRAKYKVGEVVEGTMWPGIYLVVGHGFTGSHGQERGCHGCKLTDRIHRKWQWLGPDRTLRKISSLND